MALPTQPTYSTWVQFKAYTPVAAQKTIAELDWKPFALRAEKILDSYVIVPQGEMYDIDQPLKFPINDGDGNALIPDDITLAVIEITSDLILKSEAAVAASGMVVTSESWEGSGYSVNQAEKSSSAGSSGDLKIEMPPLARRLLMPWCDKVASIKY